MNILLTGTHGFVGARIAAAMPVMASPSLRNATEDDIKRLIDEKEPDVIVHTAAISDIGECAKNPDASWRANVEIPVWLVKHGGKVLLFSTDQVYSACTGEGPFKEDETAPGNLYAVHKLEMEKRVLEVNPDSVLLRATWMYDMPIFGEPNRGNFLMNMLLHREQSFAADHRAVTWVREVAQQVKNALSLPGGVYNFGSENDLTMLEIAQWLKARLNLPVAIRETEARRHLWMDCTKAKEQGVLFRDTLGGLEQCILDYGLDR